MNAQRILFLAALTMLICAVQAQATMYKTVDENGAITLMDQPPETDSMGSALKPSEIIIAGKDATEDIYRKARVELYVTSWCRYCVIAKQFLDSKGVSYTEYDIEKDKAAAQRRKELDSRGGVPLAVINGQLILGYSQDAYEYALKQP